MPRSSTEFNSRPASSSLIAGPRGTPRSSMAPKPRIVTSSPVRPSVRVGIDMGKTLAVGLRDRSSGDELVNHALRYKGRVNRGVTRDRNGQHHQARGSYDRD